MRKHKFYLCPVNSEQLYIKSNSLITESGIEYFKKELGFYDFKIKNQNSFSDNYYREISSTYDTHNHMTFKIQGQDEKKIRNYGISKLGKLKDKELLEIGCGTGRDSELIIKKLIFILSI